MIARCLLAGTAPGAATIASPPARSVTAAKPPSLRVKEAAVATAAPGITVAEGADTTVEAVAVVAAATTRGLGTGELRGGIGARWFAPGEERERIFRKRMSVS